VKKIAILGGTFDPVHIGHLRSALELRELLDFDEVRLLPAATPPHRPEPGASAAQRLAMLRLAVAGEPRLLIDDRELRRSGPSYTYDTLAELRAELGGSVSLSLVIGMDACIGLDGWHRWRELFELAHLLVIARPDYELPAAGVVAETLRARRADVRVLGQRAAGVVALAALTPLGISATAIRAMVRSQHSLRYLVPDAVAHYIADNRLYIAQHEKPTA
jgi:nicotinate-nucleotide adenylyltransferase